MSQIKEEVHFHKESKEKGKKRKREPQYLNATHNLWLTIIPFFRRGNSSNTFWAHTSNCKQTLSSSHTHTAKTNPSKAHKNAQLHAEWVSDLGFLFVFVYCSALIVSMTERDNKERKMSEVRLFGKTIELPETAAAASGGAVSARCCDGAGEDGSNQEPPCSSDSMLEDAEEEESREVWD